MLTLSAGGKEYIYLPNTRRLKIKEIRYIYFSPWKGLDVESSFKIALPPKNKAQGPLVRKGFAPTII